MRASHILVQTPGHAQQIITELLNGQDFAALATQHSQCPSGKQGGDLGEFAQGQMVPLFEQAVLSLKPGEISEPVQTQFGFHVIRRTN